MRHRPADFPGVTIYTPTDMSGDGPQEFFGYSSSGITVPEPATMSLLGIGLVGITRRRRKS